eukprot:gene1602-4574_t
MLQRRGSNLLCMFDLRGGYHHLPLRPRAWGLSCVWWKGMLLATASLPFGMGSAAQVFQSLMLVPAGLAQRDGPIAQYLDDTAVQDTARPRVAEVLDAVGYAGPRVHPVADLLLACGFVLSVGKCVFEGRSKLTFLGIVLDTVAWTFEVSAERLAKIQAAWGALRGLPRAPARDLAAVVGLLASTAAPVPEAFAFARCLSHALGPPE